MLAASAGGFEVLRTVVGSLPADFPAAIALVHHRTVKHAELLTQLLARRTHLRVVDATAEARLMRGVVYIAPPDQHLLITPARTIALVGGVTIKHLRSAADPLFVSAAAAYGQRVAAVVLSGYDSDGSDGSRAVRSAGGIVIAQSPPSALVPSMPRSAIATGTVDMVIDPVGIAAALVLWAAQPIAAERHPAAATGAPARERKPAGELRA